MPFILFLGAGHGFGNASSGFGSHHHQGTRSQKSARSSKESTCISQNQEHPHSIHPPRSPSHSLRFYLGPIGKLADCSGQGTDKTELFIVEGESAGGSTKQGRDRRFQAVLPLRGKILNAERNDEASIYKNKELISLIVALGIDKDEENLEKLRYDRIVILTDADVDGAHIRTLLLTFLYRFKRSLFEEGKIFVAVPPLYRFKDRRSIKYCYSDKELASLTKNKANFTVQRFKGLGEMMPNELWETTLNPKTRVLRRLTVEDFAEADRTFGVLMGEKVEPRRKLIQEEGHKLGFFDLDI